ncbi:ScbA/BarX family gamma-butyrolactone biosynthesis protein [Streptomyces roseofulvus]|uniref:AfsA-related hotdog domain-containing protein n=1 Tax=Streptomyces roseofulvus TaxID=33902 RepID=UPI0031F9E99E
MKSSSLLTPQGGEAAEAEERPALSYEQTVPRGLVHRWSLSEVFLTGSRALDGRRFEAAAQLPLSHAYFRDHVGRGEHHDVLLVLEACRQSVTCAAHLHQGVPAATTFMVTAWSLEITDPEALACGTRPGELAIAGDVTGRHERGGRLRRLEFAMDLALDGRPLGRLTMDVRSTPTDQYHDLRYMQRGGEVPTAFGLPAEPAGEPVAPAAVGRLDPVNAVLDDVRSADGVVTAALSPRSFRNRSMYDHPYDHVPAMVFSEAARQCGLLLAGGAAGPARVVRLDGSFDRFAELDRPVRLSAAADPEPGAGAWLMRAEQDGQTVASVSLTLA